LSLAGFSAWSKGSMRATAWQITTAELFVWTDEIV
jgi:hypothetical protein